jgi:class 3 adenylate cyclase
MRLGSTALATERVERRLAAILAADVAGYSRLMGTDEDGTLARLYCGIPAGLDAFRAAHEVLVSEGALSKPGTRGGN